MKKIPEPIELGLQIEVNPTLCTECITRFSVFSIDLEDRMLYESFPPKFCPFCGVKLEKIGG